MDEKKIRQHSITFSEKLGYPTNPNLPYIDTPITLRTTKEILDRILILNVVCAIAYGFDPKKGINWIKREKLTKYLLKSELSLLKRKAKPTIKDQVQVEGIWALSWAINIVEDMSFDCNCADDFVYLMPDIKKGEDSSEFRNKAVLREEEEIYIALDLAYVMHWGIVHSNFNKLPLPTVIDPVAVIERRRALEWIISDAPWDDVYLDT